MVQGNESLLSNNVTGFGRDLVAPKSSFGLNYQRRGIARDKTLDSSPSQVKNNLISHQNSENKIINPTKIKMSSLVETGLLVLKIDGNVNN